MAEQDTIELLKECNAGIKMAVNSFDEVLEKIKDTKLKDLIVESKTTHEKLGDETHIMLNEYRDSEKDPNPIARAMSYMKTNMKMLQHPGDQEIADIMTDGCNMGIKSLNKYMNQYTAADEKAKNLVKKVIKVEEKLMVDLREFL